MKVMISIASTSAKVDKARDALTEQRRKVEDLTVELAKAKAEVKELWLKYHEFKYHKSR